MVTINHFLSYIKILFCWNLIEYPLTTCHICYFSDLINRLSYIPIFFFKKNISNQEKQNWGKKSKQQWPRPPNQTNPHSDLHFLEKPTPSPSQNKKAPFSSAWKSGFLTKENFPIPTLRPSKKWTNSSTFQKKKPHTHP